MREQRSIVNTIEHFRRICDLPIVIITTQKENFEYEYNDNYVTTKMIVEKDILNKYNDIYLVDYPFTNGYMADQLNFMLDHLKDLDFYDDKKKWYMSLYNADSKPSKNTFSLIFSCINKNENVIQQYSYCFKNFNNLDFISKGFAIYQSNFEIKVGLFNSSLSYKFLYNYVVGHGLTIDLQTLQKLGNFNTDFWCEDIYLTMRLKYNDIKIVPVLELENIENAVSVSQIIKQNSVWYDTTKKYRLLYNDVKKKEKYFSIQGLVGYINEFRCAVNWLLFPIMLIINILICICMKNNIMCVSIIFSYLFYSLINYLITIKTINKLSDEKYKLNFCNYLSYAITILISNIGPLYSIIFKNKKKYKTER
ncbi:MAG TPA: hypothetical protein OIM65_04585 [Bacilli bacterium]|nr:hypothetical protein [Bacilli bacterium]